MSVDPRDDLRVTSGEPPDDAGRRKTGPASTSEESDVTFLDDEDPEVGGSNEAEPDSDDSSRLSR
jgi:hypothetical protein